MDNQSLLAVLKRGAGDRAVEKCEFSIVDSESGDTDEEEDGLESKLVIRMHCKHGGVYYSLSWSPTSISDLLRRGEDAQAPAAHNRVSSPVHG